MKVTGLMRKKKEMENVFGMMANIILGNLKMVYCMEKEHIINQMEKLHMKVILLTIKEKELENILARMVVAI